jgi:hypothetical protein
MPHGEHIESGEGAPKRGQFRRLAAASTLPVELVAGHRAVLASPGARTAEIDSGNLLATEHPGVEQAHHLLPRRGRRLTTTAGRAVPTGSSPG